MVLQLAATPSRAAALKDLPVDRIYVGSELCAGRLPTLPELRRVLMADLPVTLVTPAAAGPAFAHVCRLVELIESVGKEAEVVVNDFGVLAKAAESTCVTPVMGRLLSRNFVEMSGDKFLLASREALADLKRRYRVARFEVTNYRKRIEFSEVAEWDGIPLSMHYPYMPLTISRACAFRFAEAEPDSRFDSVPCRRPCRTRSYRLNYPGQVKDDLYLRGNTVFARYAELSYTVEDLARLGIDRIVLGEGPAPSDDDDFGEILRLRSG